MTKKNIHTFEHLAKDILFCPSYLPIPEGSKPNPVDLLFREAPCTIGWKNSFLNKHDIKLIKTIIMASKLTIKPV